MADDKTPESVLVLKRCRTEDAGHVFGLRGGDILLGVNGTAWRGSVAALQKRILQHPAPSALSFQRKDAVFTILTDRADLGQWQAEPVPQTLAALRHARNAAQLGNRRQPARGPRPVLDRAIASGFGGTADMAGAIAPVVGAGAVRGGLCAWAARGLAADRLCLAGGGAAFVAQRGATPAPCLAARGV